MSIRRVYCLEISEVKNVSGHFITRPYGRPSGIPIAIQTRYFLDDPPSHEEIEYHMRALGDYGPPCSHSLGHEGWDLICEIKEMWILDEE